MFPSGRIALYAAVYRHIHGFYPRLVAIEGCIRDIMFPASRFNTDSICDRSCFLIIKIFNFQQVKWLYSGWSESYNEVRQWSWFRYGGYGAVWLD